MTVTHTKLQGHRAAAEPGVWQYRLGWVVCLVTVEAGVLLWAALLQPGIFRAGERPPLVGDLLIGAVTYTLCLPVMSLVHELGHLVAARIVGASPTALDWGVGRIRSERSLFGIALIRRTVWFGAGHVRMRGYRTRPQRFVISSAGPLTHLLTFVGIVTWGSPLRRPADFVALWLSLFLLILNFLPPRFGNGRTNDGRKMLDALTGRSRPSPLQGLDAEGLQKLLANDPRELLRIMGQVLEERPTLVAAQAVSARAWALVGRHDRAWDSWDAVMEVAPHEVDGMARWDAVFSAVVLGQRTADYAVLAAGFIELDNAVGTSSPEDPAEVVQAARHTLALAHLLVGSPATAFGLCTQIECLLTKPTQLVAVRATMGFAQVRSGDQSAAKRTLDRLRREFPANEWTLALERRLETAPL